MTGGQQDQLRSVYEKLRDEEGSPSPTPPPQAGRGEITLPEEKATPTPLPQPLSHVGQERPFFPPAVQLVLEAFEPINPGISKQVFTKPSRRSDRRVQATAIEEQSVAASRLLELCGGVDETLATIALYVSRYDSVYCPKAYDPKGFLEKLPRILGFVRSNPDLPKPDASQYAVPRPRGGFTKMELEQQERFKKYSKK